VFQGVVCPLNSERRLRGVRGSAALGLLSGFREAVADSLDLVPERKRRLRGGRAGFRFSRRDMGGFPGANPAASRGQGSFPVFATCAVETSARSETTPVQGESKEGEFRGHWDLVPNNQARRPQNCLYLIA